MSEALQTIDIALRSTNDWEEAMSEKPARKLSLSKETLQNLKNPVKKTGIRAGGATDCCDSRSCCMKGGNSCRMGGSIVISDP